MSKNHLSIVLKTVERCNINCTYCYFFNGIDDSFKKHPPYISLDTVAKIANFIKKGCQDLKIKKVTIGFHGGEPLMQKKENFKQMCEQFIITLKSVAKLYFTLQTNGMLVDEEWIELFFKYKVYVGVSIDGPKIYHDKHRIDHRGRGTYERVEKGIKKLASHSLIQKMGGIGLLCVINPENDPKEIYHHFVDNLGVKSVDFLFPDYNYNNNLEDTKIDEYGYFICKIFDEWSKSDDPTIGVRFLNSAMETLSGGKSIIYGIGPNKREMLPLITISSNGDLAPVDELRSTNKEIISTNANVSNTTLETFFKHPIFKTISKAQHELPSECLSCCWKNACGGGGIVNRFSDVNGFNNPSIYCKSLKNIYSHVAAYMINHGGSLKKMCKNLGINYDSL